MSKTLTSIQKNGKSGKMSQEHPPLADAAPDVVQALSEGAMTTTGSEEAISPKTDKSELEGIPYLGETRRQALALAGIRTVEDLRSASVEQIAGIKGIGMVNAARVKEWLSVKTEMPAIAPATPIPLTDASESALAAANQDVQEVFQRLDSAATRLKEMIPPKARDKALDRQLDKLDTVASELAEGPDTLSIKQIQDAVKTLVKIAVLLESAAGAENMPPKKQAALIEELRTRRKSLQRTLED